MTVVGYVITFLQLFLITFSESCAPPPSFGIPVLSASSFNYDSRRRAFGEQTEKANIISSVNVINAPIKDSSDLLCYEFDNRCHWHNMGFGIDRINWYQGAGTLDTNRLQISSGTSITPEGTYAIVATDSIKPSNTEAILVSDVIECQAGPAELRFMYWSSPEVQIIVCTKKTTKLYPDFDFCHPPIETGDPGPAFLLINNLDQEPFQIFIRATNFVFQAPNLEGGFAIVDNIEYFANLCTNSFKFMAQKQNNIFSPSIALHSISSTSFPTLAPPPFAPGSDFEHEDQSQFEMIGSDNGDYLLTRPRSRNPIHKRVLSNPIHNKIPYDFYDIEEFTSKPLESPITTSSFVTSLPSRRKDMPFAKEFNNDLAADRLQNLCEVLNCNFSSSPCNQYVRGSEWRISHGPVGKSATGIDGDASTLPYNQDGSFVFINGPTDKARFTIPSFVAKTKFYLSFWYHKSSKYNKFRVITKRLDEDSEHTLYLAPENYKNSRKWFEERRILPAGSYDYIAFEAGDLEKNDYIGVDELRVLDGKRRYVCGKIDNIHRRFKGNTLQN